MSEISRRDVLKLAAFGAVSLSGLQGLIGGAMNNNSAEAHQPLTLWYQQPATAWTEALPIGNGRLGAMIFGGVPVERFQLNDSTLWAGGPYDPNNPDALKHLQECRDLIFAGKYKEAQDLVNAKMMATPIRQMPYQTVGDLLLTFQHSADVTDYRRQLDLDLAITVVDYVADGIRYMREMFACPVRDVIVVRLTTNKPATLSFTASIETPMTAAASTQAPGDLVLSGVNNKSQTIDPALKFEARCRVVATGGTTTVNPDTVSVANADSALLFIDTATSFKNYHDVSGDPSSAIAPRLAAAASTPYPELAGEHTTEHQKLFHRVKLDLGTTEPAKLPTDQRIAKESKREDPALASLYFQFGRYLLICSSRPGGQPANLQGIWNQSINPPWGSKYTININTEMNYWPAEPANLPECVDPLVQMVKDISQRGVETAKVHWGAAGWVTHHNTDLWRATAPIDQAKSGMWPTGGAWLCKHLWDKYEFGGDKLFLADVYPIMKGAAQFFLDSLVEEPTHHWLVTCPSVSPEHPHVDNVSICAGPAMDTQIIRDLLNNCIAASELLGLDADDRKRWTATRDRLAPFLVGKAGQLQEWLEDWDMEAPDIHHRHVSHLYALYPSNQIDIRTTPDLAAAAKKSLEIRGDMATGWGTAWRLNLWARLADGEHAYKILEMLLSSSRTYPDMFDAHPPFQIDGNFGGCAGIMEMLLQSHGGEIQFLPALPSAWPTGSVSGLRARGGFELAMNWANGKLARAELKSNLGKTATIRSKISFKVQADGRDVQSETRSPGVFSFATEAGRTYLLTPL
jgi:alpha-L-fucosidase 2